MLSTVVTRVRRRLRRSQKSQDQPPDLRRWSDFMNPFPHVTPGGYSKYYAKHGLPEPKPLPSTPSSQITHSSSQQRSAVPSDPSSHVRLGSYTISEPIAFPSPNPYFPSSPSASLPTRRREKKDSRLSTIEEASPAPSLLFSPSSPKRIRAKTISTTTTNSSSLRRKQRREILRTPSVERDWQNNNNNHVPSSLDLFHDHDSSPLLPPSSSSPPPPSSLSSHESSTHSSPVDSETPPTTFEGLFDEELVYPDKAYHDAKLGMRTECNKDEVGVVDPHERSESRSSYCTARSEFFDD